MESMLLRFLPGEKQMVVIDVFFIAEVSGAFWPGVCLIMPPVLTDMNTCKCMDLNGKFLDTIQIFSM